MKEYFKIKDFVDDIEKDNDFQVVGIEILGKNGYQTLILDESRGTILDKYNSILDKYFVDKEEL